MVAEMVLDVKQLRAAGRSLRSQIDKDIRNQLNRELRAIGKVVAVEAVAAARFKIDASVMKVRTKGPSVIVSVRDSEPKPHHGKAVAFEHHGKPGKLRHPTFGHRDRWTDTNSAARPFLTPTFEARAGWAYEQIGGAVDRAFGAAGFH